MPVAIIVPAPSFPVLPSKSPQAKVARFDFSDPQGGKGPCDRLAATCKSHNYSCVHQWGSRCYECRRYEDCITFSRRSHWCSSSSPAGFEGQANVQQQQKIPGISKLNNFQYRDGHLLAWRAYGIGIGKRVVDKITGTIAIINTRWASYIGNLKVIKLFSYCCYLLIENNNARVSMKIENYCLFLVDFGHTLPSGDMNFDFWVQGKKQEIVISYCLVNRKTLRDSACRNWLKRTWKGITRLATVNMPSSKPCIVFQIN